MNAKNTPYVRTRIKIGHPRSKKTITSRGRASVLVDTGASVSIVPDGLLPALRKLGPIETQRVIMHTANGVKEATAVKDLEVCLADICAKVNVTLSSPLPAPLVLGSDFLARSKCAVDFEKGELRCGKKVLKIERRD